jgi:AraC-like DNA-binding protein
MDELLEFRHSPHLTGVGVMHAQYTERKWHVVNSAYGLAVPSDWVGEIAYRGQRRVFGAGEVFCTEPGEVHETSRILRPGSFKVLLIDEAPLLERVAEVAPHLKTARFGEMGRRLTPELGARLGDAFDVIERATTPLHVQSCLLELVAVLVDELLDDPRPHRRPASPSVGLSRVRECLHEDDDGWIDLDTLSAQAGMSRFHLLRSFKQRYGLPPHAYQVGLRIAKAQRLLRKRLPLAQVAAECGFTDQSHLTRHFKQVLGVTPGRFARDLGRRQ